MTISSTDRKAGPFAGDGSTTVFPYAFKVFATSDLYVVKADSTGAETVLALTTHYTATMNGNQDTTPGGNVTLLTALAVGETLIVTTRLDYLQGVALTNQGGFYPTVINSALDRLVIYIQQLSEQISRTLKVAITSPDGTDVELPTPIAYNLIGWNAAADGLQNVDPTYSTALSTDLANTSDTAKGDALIGFKQSGTGATARTVHDKLGEFISVKDFGAVGDGVTDDTTAFNAACAASNFVLVPAGTYKIAGATTVTLSSTLEIQAGAILKPASGVHLNLTKAPIAGLYQIFDRSAGGVVQFIGAGNPTVYAEWWGATSGTGGRTDNDVPIQHAIDSIQSIVDVDFTTKAPNDDNNGGVVKLGYQGEYLMSSYIHIRNRTRLEGQNGNFCVLKANTGTWDGSPQMVIFQNGTSSQFWCRLDSLTVNANEIPAITQCIYAPAWQESCGLRDVLVRAFRGHGVFIDHGYGGAVGCRLSGVQFFPSASASSGRCDIYIDVPYTLGVYNLLLEEVSFAGSAALAPPGNGSIGCYAKGRVRIQCRGVHVEGHDYGFSLDTDASLYGVLSAGGNPAVLDVVGCASTWTGKIDCQRINKGGATNLVKSYAASSTGIYTDVEPIFGRVVYPHTPSEIVAYARNTSAAGNLDSNAYGFSSITRTAAGQYTLAIDATKFKPAGGSSYRVRVEVGDFAGGGKTYYVAGQAASQLQLVFKNTSGANTDCDTFDVFVYGKPGV